MRIFLTGATGHLGRNIVDSLLDGGHEVVALTRGDAPSLPAQVTPARGDLLDADSLVRAGRDCELTVHCAAVYADDPARAHEMSEVAVRGTRHVLDAAAANGHQRVVAASSMVTVGFSSDRRDARSENDWNHRPFHPYFCAKVDAEREAWRHAVVCRVPLVMLCPGGLIGPLDHRLTPTMRYLAELANGTAQTLQGGVNYVDVRDVADAFVAATTRATPGQRYLLTGECISMRELGQLVRSLTGTRPAHLPLPRRVVLGFARLLQPDRYAMAKESVGRWPSFRSERAKADLSFHPRPVEESLADALRWLARSGAIHPGRVASWEGRLDPHGDLYAHREDSHASLR